MGNEHSKRNNNNSNSNGQPGTASGRERDAELSSPTTSTGMPVSFSFLAKKRNSTKSGLSGIVVVNEGASSSSAGTIDPREDPDLKRIKEIPHFLPLLRGVLPGHRDLPDVYQKVDPRPVFAFFSRLQQHFRQCAQTVASEQGRLFARIVEVDQLIASLHKKVASSAKKLDSLGAELKKVDSVSEQLESAEVLLQELVRSASSLNQLLPPEEHLPPMETVFTPILASKKQQTTKRTTVTVGRPAATGGQMMPGTREEEEEEEAEEGRSIGRVSECLVVDSDC